MRHAFSALDIVAADIAAIAVAVICCFYAAFTQADSCQAVTTELAKSDCFEKARRCSTVEDPFKRLLCYDEFYKPVARAPLGDSKPIPAAASHPKPVAASRPTPVTDTNPLEGRPPEAESPSAPSAEVNKGITRQTGKEESLAGGVASKKGEPKPTEMPAKIVKLEKNSRGNTLITLDNNQVWRVIEASSHHIRVGDTVVVKKGAFGSNNLAVEGQNRKSKVTRIQ